MGKEEEKKRGKGKGRGQEGREAGDDVVGAIQQ